MTCFISLLFDLNKYSDRLNQIINALPNDTKLIIFTKNKGAYSTSLSNVNIIEIENGIFDRSVFLKIKLLVKLYKYSKKDKLVIIDWFMNFNYILLFRFIFPKNLIYIYSPVSSSYGWFYKRFKKIIPSCGLRYDYLRLKEVFQDFFTVKSADYLIVQSKELIEYYSHVYGIKKSRVFFNYNSHKPMKYNFILQNSNDVKNKIKIGFIGNIERHKGTLEMFNIFKNLDPFKFELLLAGAAKGKENIEIFNNLKSLDNVSYYGYIKQSEINSFYDEIDCLILLSYHEGSARVIREFIELGKPIFMYDNPGMDYCKGLENVFVYNYGEIEKVEKDILEVKINEKSKRSLPEYMSINHLGSIMDKMK